MWQFVAGFLLGLYSSPSTCETLFWQVLNRLKELGKPPRPGEDDDEARK